MGNHITKNGIQVDELPFEIQDIIRNEKINRPVHDVLCDIADIWDKLR